MRVFLPNTDLSCPRVWARGGRESRLFGISAEPCGCYLQMPERPCTQRVRQQTQSLLHINRRIANRHSYTREKQWLRTRLNWNLF